MGESELWVITFAISAGVGYHTINSVFLTRGFVERFGKFKKAFDEKMREAVHDFIYELQTKVGQSNPDEIIDFILEWTKNQEVVRGIIREYDKLLNTLNYVTFTFAASALSGFFSMYYPYQFEVIEGTLWTWIQISYFTAFLGVASIFYHLHKFNKLRSRISKFELGESIELIIEEELTEK